MFPSITKWLVKVYEKCTRIREELVPVTLFVDRLQLCTHGEVGSISEQNSLRVMLGDNLVLGTMQLSTLEFRGSGTLNWKCLLASK